MSPIKEFQVVPVVRVLVDCTTTKNEGRRRNGRAASRCVVVLVTPSTSTLLLKRGAISTRVVRGRIHIKWLFLVYEEEEDVLTLMVFKINCYR